ncbi:MAG: nuclear transport factor 2 family protein [Sphingomicrobium sp.]
MRRTLFMSALALVIAAPAHAGPAEDATATVTGLLDKFNGGDINTFFAGHRDGALIIDEFVPYVWGGSGSAQRWASDYMKDAEARGISGGRVDYSPPTQASSDGSSAYIVLPTTYRFVQKAKKMAGKGSMTFVMNRVGPEWKIASWTYSGATPTAE